MPKAGFCSVCGENVFLTDAGECAKAGHPSNCITGVYYAEQGGQAAPPAPASARAEKTKKPFYKKWWVWAIALVVILIAATSGGGGTADTDTASTGEEPAAAPAEEPTVEVTKIGQPLQVDDLIFTVNDAKTVQELKNPLGSKKGNWILVTVTVENKSKEAVTLDSSLFELVDKNGATYETDSDGLMYIDENNSLFLEKLNPNLSKKGQVLFAVADGAKPSDFKLQVESGFFGSETGEIALTK